METFALVIRYGFLVALAVEAILLGRAFFGMLRAKALPAPQIPPPATEATDAA